MRPKSTALFVALALAAAATLPATANAQTFGDESDFAMSADRLMGVYLFDEGPEYTAIGLGASPGDHWYMRTRLGIDYFVAGSFGIGGSIAYINVDGDGRGDGNDGFLFSPRVSYAIQIGDSFGFWPRGGVTYRDNDDNSELALTMEGMFWGSPVSNFAFVFGPAFDIGIAGDDEEARSIGIITVGLLGWW